MEARKTFVIPRKKEREIIFGEVVLYKNISNSSGIFKVKLNRLYIFKYFRERFVSEKRFLTPVLGNSLNEIKLDFTMNYFQFSVYKDETINNLVARLEPKGWVMLDPEIRGKQIGSLMMALLIEMAQKEFPDADLLDVSLSSVDCNNPINCKRRNRFYEKFGWKIIVDENGDGVAKANKLKDLKPVFDKNVKLTDLDFDFLVNYRKKLAITRYENVKNKEFYREYKKDTYELLGELNKPLIHHIKRRLSLNPLIVIGREFYYLFKDLAFRR